MLVYGHNNILECYKHMKNVANTRECLHYLIQNKRSHFKSLKNNVYSQVETWLKSTCLKAWWSFHILFAKSFILGFNASKQLLPFGFAG